MADYEGSGKIFLDSLIGQLRDQHKEVVAAFENVHDDMDELFKLYKKNKRKIRGLKCAVFVFGIGLLVAASELAERKRSENYLKAEIDELKEKVDKQQNYICGLDQKIDAVVETDGGAADA